MKRVVLLLLLFPAFICWGGEKQQPRPHPENGVPIRSDRLAQDNSYPDPLILSYFKIPPHCFLDEDKKVRGAIYDLIEDHISPEIGVKFQWDIEPSSVSRQILNLKEGRNNISCLMVYVPERLRYLIYSKAPYYYSQSIIAVPKNSPLKEVRKVSDISSMVLGYVQDGYITPFMRNPSIKFDFHPSPDFLKLNLKKAMVNRIDGIYSPGKASTLLYLQQFGMLDEFRIIDLPEEPTPLHIAFPKKFKELADKFDQAFERMDGQQVYLKLLSRYIDVSNLKHVSERP